MRCFGGGRRGGECGMCLQESLPGVPEPAGARHSRGSAAIAGGGGPGDAGSPRSASPAAAPLRPRGRLQAGAARGVLTPPLLAGPTTWSIWRDCHADSTLSPSWMYPSW